MDMINTPSDMCKGENVMDAIQFIKEKERMCKAGGSCILCPACLDGACAVGLRSSVAPERQINLVKVWAEQHPAKTRQDVFLEQYPEAKIDLNGVLMVCPAPIFLSHRGKGGGCSYFNKNCAVCRREFWSQEVE